MLPYLLQDMNCRQKVTGKMCLGLVDNGVL